MSYCTQRRNLVTDFTQRKAEGGGGIYLVRKCAVRILVKEFLCDIHVAEIFPIL